MSGSKILKEILENKKAELAAIFKIKAREERMKELKKELASAPAVRNFRAAISSSGVRVIAEVKKASPSKGIIRQDFEPVAIAKEYESSGAAAISVLTDKKYFMGEMKYLEDVRRNVAIPVLRKDFLIDEFQLLEARVAGADTALLIAAALGESGLKALIKVSRDLSMEPLVEVHTEAELDISLNAGADIIGINNRNLNTFEVDLNTTEKLMERIPGDKTVVTESGIHTVEDIRRLSEAGVDAFLIGESLMREKNAGHKLKELLSA